MKCVSKEGGRELTRGTSESEQSIEEYSIRVNKNVNLRIRVCE